MPNFSIVVEGAHDASFLGQLLKARGFEPVSRMNQVPTDWRMQFPRVFPADGETIGRIMRYPEIFLRDGTVVGITTSGSDSKLISALRSVIDAMGPDMLSGIGIFVDSDDKGVGQRFTKMQKQIRALNSAAVAQSDPGYPVVVPNTPGEMERGTPSIGIFVFPDNENNGALENILIECARVNHPKIAQASIDLVERIDKSEAAGHVSLKALRSGMGRLKATVGTIANILRPGVSAAASLAQTNWLAAPARDHSMVQKVDLFLERLIDS